MIVEAFLIAAMAALYFAIMPRCFWANLFMKNMVFSTEEIKNVNAFRVLAVAKFGSVIRLNGSGRVDKVEDGSLHKVHR